MNIEFFAPFQKALERMKTALFRPFDLNKWFAVGFTAFLAGLMDSGGSNSNFGMDADESNFDWVEDFPDSVFDWFSNNPEWVALVAFIVLLVIALVVVLLWLGARGKFMFLDNVVHNQKLIKKPWHDYRNEGNSLFLWRLMFTFVVFLIIGSFIYSILQHLSNYHFDFEYIPWFSFIVPAVLVFLAIVVILAYINLFLDSFIVPIMYRRRISATDAWSVFISLMRNNLAQFVVYGLFYLMLAIIAFLAILVIGFGTCCIGFVLFMIPYIGSVLLLPIYYTFRGLGPDFIAQFGEEWNVFPQPSEGDEPAGQEGESADEP